MAAAENNESGELAWMGECRAALAPGPGSGQVVSTAWQRIRWRQDLTLRAADELQLKCPSHHRR
jgi:hypothetical protein